MSKMTAEINKRLVIDPLNKTIEPKYRNQKLLYVAKGDRDSVIIGFEIPRYVDGYDMSADENVIHIHYANMDKEDEAKISRGFSDAIEVKAEEDEATGETYPGNAALPPVSGDATYVAVYSEEDLSDRMTFWNFIESIFERINLIFEYFATVFGW